VIQIQDFIEEVHNYSTWADSYADRIAAILPWCFQENKNPDEPPVSL
jgi:hypothetical protein